MDIVLVEHKNKHYLIRENDKPVSLPIIDGYATIEHPGTYCFTTKTTKKNIFGFVVNKNHESDSMCFAKPGIYKIDLKDNKIAVVRPITCF